jgi:hypothetical protein
MPSKATVSAGMLALLDDDPSTSVRLARVGPDGPPFIATTFMPRSAPA